MAAVLTATLGLGLAATTQAGDAAVQAIVATKGCGVCHVIPGVPGAKGMVGPNLTGLANRDRIAGGAIENTEENLRAWLKNPQALKPGTSMFNPGLTDGEIDLLIEFMVGIPD